MVCCMLELYLLSQLFWDFFFFWKKNKLYKYLLRELEILFGDSRF